MKTKLFSLATALLFFSCFSVQAQMSGNNTIPTEQGQLQVHPIQHGTLGLTWNNKTIYVDPTGGADAFADLNEPNIILITHLHGDHFNLETLRAINPENATIVVPQSVADEMPGALGARQIVLDNGEETKIEDITVRAVPMYNLPEEDARHPKGWGNGYVLTMGGKKVYISGDTEGIPEMRQLQNIDVAFVCMNLPYTMDVEQAADAVLDFQPAVVYPYHYRGQDTQQFKELVNAGNKGIEVRLRDWYNN